jgi:hypothetical protein
MASKLKTMILLLLVVVVVCATFQMCIPKEYFQFAYLKNGTTNDTLEIQFNSRDSRWTLLPAKDVQIACANHVKKIDEDNLKFLIDDNAYSSIKVFRHDTCVAHWQGSMSNMGDSIHDFFNHDAWQGKIHGDDYFYYFTIVDADLNPIPQTD